jgi:regulator of sigma E protease
MTLLTTISLFVVVLSLLVLAHELGHFVTAKLAGIRVQEFGLGFPPRVFGIRRGETLYSLNALPLGGFVKMLGENGEVVDTRAFASQPCGIESILLSVLADANRTTTSREGARHARTP